LLRLAAGDERRQPLDIAVVLRRHVQRPLLIVLRLRLLLRLMLRRVLLRLMMLLIVLRLMMLLIVLRLIVLLIVLRLMVLLLARIELLWFARREWFAHLRLVVAVVIAVVVGRIVARAAAGRRLLEIRLILAKLFLRGGDQAEIMFGVLIIILGGDRISGALRVAGELEIFFGDMGRRSANFHVLPVGLVHSRQRILVMMATFAIAPAHAFVLSVSHGLLFRQPRYL
jgi:hypothetical protein